MIELFKSINVDWLGKRKLFLAVSGLLISVGLVSLLTKGGFRYGVDFRGGTIVQVRFKEKPPVDRIRALLRGGGASDSQIQELRGATTSKDFLIELDTPSEEADASRGREVITGALNKEFPGQFEIVQAQSVGP